jgi:hypothetical protein
VARVLAELERFGLLLVQDGALPSVATLIAGEPIRGSWWGHRAGKTIFDTLSELEDRDDLVFARLLSGKVTLVHAPLIPALVAVGSARQDWQTRELSPAASVLLERVDAEGRVRVTGKPAKEIEARLLALGQSVHTESGAHATELVSWAALRRSRRIAELPALADGQAALERAAAGLGDKRPALPWQTLKSRSRSRRR